MNIRTATIDDSTKIAQTHKASIQSLCKDLYTKEEIAGWTSILSPEIYENAIKEKIMIIAVKKNEIRGLGIIDIKKSELCAIYVHPDSTGKGVGKKILSHLEVIAKDNDIHQLTLGSTMNALGFYKKHGYMEESEVFHELPNNLRLTCIKMHKIL
jgi:putative acetyltransferase